MRDDTEVEISGGFKAGLAKAFLAFVRNKPHVRVIQLTSGGGLVAEGERVSSWIAAHHVDTFVPKRCFSACTLAFIAGQKRWLGFRALIGFHASSNIDSSGHRVTAWDIVTPNLLARAGVSEAFIIRATGTSPTGIWEPSQEELLAAHVVTNLAQLGQFAPSAFDAEWTARLENADPALRQLATTHDSDFESLLVVAEAASQTGRPESAIQKLEAVAVSNTVRRYLPFVPDDVLVAYGRLRYDEIEALELKSPVGCYAVTHRPGAHETDATDPSFAARKSALDVRVLSASIFSQRPSDTPKPVFDRFFSSVETKVSLDDLETLTKPQSTPVRQAQYCRTLAAEYEAALALPPKDSAMVLRQLLAP